MFVKSTHLFQIIENLISILDCDDDDNNSDEFVKFHLCRQPILRHCTLRDKDKLAMKYREVNKNHLLGGQFLIFLPKNPEK